MDDIRFKVWDKVAKKMSEPFSLFGEFTLLGAVHLWQKEILPESELSSIERLNDLIILQSTGKEDKNKNQSYQGDLIVVKSYPFYGDAPEVEENGKYQQLNYVGEVFYWKEEACWYVGLHVVSDRVLGGACGGALYNYNDFEIIGNIYENPELLGN